MKKTIIALAVAGFSFNAAALDLDSLSTEGAAKFASELNLPAELTLANAAEKTVKADVGVAAVATGNLFVRYDFTNATISDAPIAPAALEVAYVAAASIVSGGQVGTSSVVFKADTTAPVLATHKAILTLAKLRATGGSVGVTMSVFDNEVSALQNVGALKTKSGDLIEFAPSLVAKVGTKGSTIIDVTKDAKLFTTGTDFKVATISTLDLSAVASVRGADGISAAPFVAADSVLEVAGDFSAGVKKTDGTVDFASAITGGGTIDTAKTTNSLLVFKPAATGKISFKIDGETVLENQAFNAVFKPVATAGYTLAASYDLGEIGTISKSGDNAELNLALSGNTSFNQFVRVTNDGNVGATNLNFTVIDAAGESATVALADIASGASSTPVAVKALFAQAAAQNAALNADSLLRVKVAGEAAANSLSIESYVLSKDANSVNNLN